MSQSVWLSQLHSRMEPQRRETAVTAAVFETLRFVFGSSDVLQRQRQQPQESKAAAGENRHRDRQREVKYYSDHSVIRHEKPVELKMIYGYSRLLALCLKKVLKELKYEDLLHSLLYYIVN